MNLIRSRWLIAVLLLSAAVFPAAASATTYYVSPDGSDGNDGMTLSTPWKTVAKVNGFSGFLPGDSVLFQTGKNFTGAALSPAVSGTAQAPITFGTYDGPSTARPQITLGASFTGRGYLTFRGIRFPSFQAGSAGSPANGISLRNDAITGATGTGISAYGNSWTIANSDIYSIGGDGLDLTGDTVSVTNDTILNTGQSTSRAAAIALNVSNATVTDNVIQNFRGVGIAASAHSTKIVHNFIGNDAAYSPDPTTGLKWTQNDSVAGTSSWTANTITGTRSADISVASGAHPFSEDLSISGNSLMKFSGADMVGTSGATCSCSTTANAILGISSGTTYFISPGQGIANDSPNSGKTPLVPFQSLCKVTTGCTTTTPVTLNPGDVVLLHGSFSTRLQPQSGSLTGSTEKPVVYGSYSEDGGATFSNVTGGPAVGFNGSHDVVVQDLQMSGGAGSTRSPTTAVIGASAAPSTRVIVYGNAISNWYAGVQADSGDSYWTIENNVISNMTDNGIYFDRSGSPYVGGDNLDVLYNTISHTGLGPLPSGSYPHGIYANATNAHIIGNTISDFEAGGTGVSSGISIRFSRSTVEGNTVDGSAVPSGSTVFGIDYDDYDQNAKNPCVSAAACVSVWAYNRITGVATAGIYTSPDCLSGCPAQSFTIADNTVLMSPGAAVKVDFEYPNTSLDLEDNVGTNVEPVGADPGSTLDFKLWYHAPQPPFTATYIENHNNWWNGVSQTGPNPNHYFLPNGGLPGAADQFADPKLSTTDPFALTATSPGINAGTSSVTNVSYSGVCTGQLFTYCGSAPDMGANEYGAPTTSPGY